MYFHKFNNKDEAIGQLEAYMYNYDYEVAILCTLKEFSYSGKVFNARYATQLDKVLAEEFGTEIIKNWGIHGEDKEVNLVHARLTSGFGTYGKGYELKIYYKAQEWNKYEKKITNRKTDDISFYNVHSAEEIQAHIPDMITSRLETIEKMRGNLQTIDTWIEQYNKLTEQIMRYNEGITFPLSDLLRIK